MDERRMEKQRRAEERARQREGRRIDSVHVPARKERSK
jgi:hypothetical protein